MKVWIVNPYGNLPGEGWSPYRSTSIAEALVKRGHEVVWWVSDFEHRSKKQRKCGTVDFSNGYTAEVIPASRYSRHISASRIMHERNYAHSLCRGFHRREDRPDIIVHGEPAVCFSDISMKAVRYCRCPLVVDVIDLWPELFEIVVPKIAQPIAKLLLAPLYQKRSRFLRQADGFLAVAQDYLELAQTAAPRTPGKVVYLGVDNKSFSFDIQGQSCDPRITGLQKCPGDVWCVYVGTLGRNYDIDAVLECARRFKGTNVKFMIAGDGDYRATVQVAADEGSVTYLGRLPFQSLVHLYSRCDIALACYAKGSTVSMPFKAFDYLAAGIAIVTSLDRDLGMFVRTHRLGTTYKSGEADALYAAVAEMAKSSSFRRDAAHRARELGKTMDYAVQYGHAADFLEQVAAYGPKNISI